MSKLKPIPTRTVVQVDPAKVLEMLLAEPSHSIDFKCTHEEGKIVNAYVRRVTAGGLSQKAYRHGQEVLGYTLALTDYVKEVKRKHPYTRRKKGELK